jgi:hypothetical protein
MVEPFSRCTTNNASPGLRAKRFAIARVGTAFRADGVGLIGATVVESVKLTAVRARLLAICVVTATLGLASCGGKSTPSATTTKPRASAAEVRWRRQVRVFAAGIVSELERIQVATGGGPKAGPIGARLDARVLLPGPQRRSLLAALTALERCPRDVVHAVPAPPSPLLVPARTALGNACEALASAAQSLHDALTASASATSVDPGTLDFARGRARDGVRLVIDALAIVARAAGAGSSG